MRTRFLPILVIMLAMSARGLIAATDWPQFLGPTRNGVYGGGDVCQGWSTNGPAVVWQKAVGHGFSGPVVADRKLILFHRLTDNETVECLDARTGSPIWSFAYPTSYQDEFGFDDGPRATPAIAEERVFTFGAEGKLHCLDLASGKRLWSVDVKADFQAANGFFGMACSPLVEGDAVLLNIGGAKGAGIVAFDKTNGKLLWRASDDEASYSSPVAATIGGQRYALFFTRNGLVAIDPVGGSIRFQYPWHSRNRTSVNAASPLIDSRRCFLAGAAPTMTPAARCGSPPESASSDCLFAASSRTARPETRRFRQRAGRAGRAPRQYDKTPVASPHLVGGAENGYGAGSCLISGGCPPGCSRKRRRSSSGSRSTIFPCWLRPGC